MSALQRQPDKWRETIVDPLSMKLNGGIRILKVLGYPHAGNDIFECEGEQNGKRVHLFLKVARNSFANIINEVNSLSLMQGQRLPIPEILSCNTEHEPHYIATRAINGSRLSSILSETPESDFLTVSKSHLTEYGKVLAKIHNVCVNADTAPTRVFMSLPSDDKINDQIRFAYEYASEVFANTPFRPDESVLIHGDCHYANMLFKKGRVTGIIDWEYAGKGCREYDLAWSLVLRPGQQFLSTETEINAFLDAYSSISSFSPSLFFAYYVNCSMFFYLMNINNPSEEGYRNKLIELMRLMVK